MLIIIDAYNVLKQMAPHQDVTSQEIDRFIKTLVARSYERNYLVILVFDGGGSRQRTTTRQGNVTIMHAGCSHSADDLIVELLQQHRSIQERALISADRELRSAAHTTGTLSIDPATFIRVISQPLTRDTSPQHSVPQRLHEDRSSTSDGLMEEAARTMRTMPFKEESSPQERRRSGKLLSKDEKRYERIVSKL